MGISQEVLLSSAAEMFDAIEKSSGDRFWEPSSGLPGAIDGFDAAIVTLGVMGIIDAAKGGGMTHIELGVWLDAAKKLTAT